MDCSGCKSASSVILDTILGEFYCVECGLIAEDNVVDYTDLTFTFTGDEKSIHHSLVSFIKANRGLGSYIGDEERQFLGVKSKHLNSPQDNLERSFYEALPYLQVSWNMLNLPQDLQIASAILYRKCIRKKLTAGRNLAAMSLAAISKACSDAGFAINLSKPSKELGVTPEKIQAYYKVIVDNTRPDTSRDYLLVYIKKGIETLGLPETVSESAVKFGKKVIAKHIEVGKHPAVVAGAVIYKVCYGTENEISQAKIAENLKISERSIRRTFTDVLFIH